MSSRRTGLALAVTLAFTLALAACGGQATAGRAAATTTPAGTPTPGSSVIAPGPKLTWSVVHAAAQASGYNAQYAIAPGDGDMAYGCDYLEVPQQGEIIILVTTDRGATWTQAGTLTAPTAVTSCALAVDATNPRILTLAVDNAPMGASPMASAFLLYASFDGGASWRMLPEHGDVWRLASYQNDIYLAAGVSDAQGQDDRNLWVSDDQLANWRSFDLAAASFNPTFWLNPRTGSLLAANTSAGNGGTQFAISADGGARWTTRTAPLGAQSLDTLLATPQANGQWRICDTLSAPPPSVKGPPSLNSLECSVDGGQTWATLPALNLLQRVSKGSASYVFYEPADVFALTDDGALLATALDDNDHTTLYRLPAGASQWQSLGAPPGQNTPSYYGAPGAGVIWLSLGGASAPFATAALP